MPGTLETGLSGVRAAHHSPAVPLIQSDLDARILGPKAKALSKAVRTGTGEEAFFKKIMGTGLGNVVLGDKYISENADDIARILDAYKTTKMPNKALLDKVKAGKLKSLLGRAGGSLSKFEHSLANLFRRFIPKIRK